MQIFVCIKRSAVDLADADGDVGAVVGVRFRKVFLEPGEKKDVDFFIDQEEFSYYGKNMETVSSGMKLRISIGNSSDHLVSENIIQA